MSAPSLILCRSVFYFAVQKLRFLPCSCRMCPVPPRPFSYLPFGSLVSLSQVSMQPVPPFPYPFCFCYLIVIVKNCIFGMLTLGRGLANPPESTGSFRPARRPVGYTCPPSQVPSPLPPDVLFLLRLLSIKNCAVWLYRAGGERMPLLPCTSAPLHPKPGEKV